MNGRARPGGLAILSGLCVLGLAWMGSAGPKPKSFHKMAPQEAACALKRAHERHRDYRQRLLTLSARFVGMPYRLDPLGEGPSGKVDRDPLFSLAKVDCQTLIETLIAMAHAPDLGGARAALAQVRYHEGKIAYRRRHHFPSSQWLPANQRLGVLRDVTHTIAPRASLKMVDVVVGPRSWRGAYRKWRKLGDAAPRGRFTLPVLPLDVAIKSAHRFPPGSLLNLVRVPRRGVPEPISHQGLIAVAGERRLLRQATDLGRRPRVVELSLARYLRHTRRYYQKAKRPVLGVNVQLLTPSAQLSRIAAKASEAAPRCSRR